MFPSIPLYSQQSFPILAWKASFTAPDTDTLKHEHKALQLLTNGPFNAIPNTLLYNLKQIGLPAQAHSLRTTSLAARTRNALHTMRNYHNNIRLIHDHYLHDETRLHPPLQNWIDNSIILSLHHAVQTTQHSYNQLAQPINIQRQLTASLLAQIHQLELQPLLHKRWTRFFTNDQLPTAISNAISNLHFITSTCKPCTTSAILRTWLYAWTTNNRFGNYNQPCPICNAPNSDTLRHFYDCPPLSIAARTTLNQPNLPTSRDFFFLSLPYSHSVLQHRALCTLNAIHIYCITNTYHSIKHRPTSDVTDTYHAHLKRLLQHDPRLNNIYLLALNNDLYH